MGAHAFEPPISAGLGPAEWVHLNAMSSGLLSGGSLHAHIARHVQRAFGPYCVGRRPEKMPSMTQPREIPGTKIFDGVMARRGYALNKMCYSLNDEAMRSAFLSDEAAYMDRFALTPAQRDAIVRRDVLAMLDVGGNVYYLAKLAGALGLDVQDLGALQTNTTVEEFKRRLVEAGR